MRSHIPAAHLSGYICGIVLLEHTSQPWMYALQRLVETTICIGAALAVSLVPKLLRIEVEYPPAPADP